MSYGVKTGKHIVVIKLSSVNFTTDEIKFSLLQIDVNKGKGQDRIWNALLKKSSQVVAEISISTPQFNCLQSSFPNKWKVAEIVLI